MLLNRSAISSEPTDENASPIKSQIDVKGLEHIVSEEEDPDTDLRMRESKFSGVSRARI